MAKFGPNIANKEDDDTIIEDVITNKKLLKGWKWIIYDDESVGEC